MSHCTLPSELRTLYQIVQMDAIEKKITLLSESLNTLAPEGYVQNLKTIDQIFVILKEFLILHSYYKQYNPWL